MKEYSIKTYAKENKIKKTKVYELIRNNNVQWRFLFPETREYKVINSSTLDDKIELSETELGKNAYALFADISIQHVNVLQKQGRLKWRFLYPITKEYVVIDTSFVYKGTLLKKE